jgi:hypothetical protein
VQAAELYNRRQGKIKIGMRIHIEAFDACGIALHSGIVLFTLKNLYEVEISMVLKF